MARHASPEQKYPLKVYLTEKNMALLRLATYSALRGKPAHGATSELVNAALDLFFNQTSQKEQNNVQS